jgi:hypothetical protein
VPFEWLALFAASWFGLHPAIAETVNYIIQRGDLYCTLGCVAALFLFARYVHFCVQPDCTPYPSPSRHSPNRQLLSSLSCSCCTSFFSRHLTNVHFTAFAEMENDHRMFFSFVELVLAAVCAAWLLLQRRIALEHRTKLRSGLVAITIVTCLLTRLRIGRFAPVTKAKMWRVKPLPNLLRNGTRAAKLRDLNTTFALVSSNARATRTMSAGLCCPAASAVTFDKRQIANISKESGTEHFLRLLLACGLRRHEAVGLRIDDLQQREEHWAIVDLLGKAGHILTVPIPDWVKGQLDEWLRAAGIARGRIFRRVTRMGRTWGDCMTEKSIWHAVKDWAKRSVCPRLAPHDLRRTCARLCHASGGELEQIQFLLGHVSVQTTERYLGRKQRIRSAVNDRIGIEPNP